MSEVYLENESITLQLSVRFTRVYLSGGAIADSVVVSFEPVGIIEIGRDYLVKNKGLITNKALSIARKHEDALGVLIPTVAKTDIFGTNQVKIYLSR
jgi:hypothetical protein